MYKNAKYYRCTETIPKSKTNPTLKRMMTRDRPTIISELKSLGVDPCEAESAVEAMSKNGLKKLERYGILSSRIRKLLRQAGH